MAYKSKYTGLQIDDILDSVGGKQVYIEDLASIRAGAQKGATALQSYTEKYTGTVTGIKINGETKSGSGIIDLGTISTDISGKVDKVDGKQLSTEDFTTALKTKLEQLNNYDDTELSNALLTLRSDFNEIVSGDTTTAIKTFNEVIAFLDGITDTQDLGSIIASIEQQIAAKQDNLVSGTNIKTINGESILGEGDLTVEGGAKVYNLSMPIDDNGDIINQGNVTQEEFDAIVNADILMIDNVVATKISLDGAISIVVSVVVYDVVTSYTIIIEEQSLAYQIFQQEVIVPNKTSQLENDSNFVSSDGLKTINGESIVGSGDITISGGIDGDYLPSTGGTIDGELDVIGSITADTVSSNRYENENGTAALTISTDGLSLELATGAEILSVTTTGDGTKFLSDDGTYKIIDTSGGSSSEDIRYFTEFTKTDFIRACNNESTISSNGLYDAIINNKIICIPTTNNAGYIIAESAYSERAEGADIYSFSLRIESEFIEYIAVIDVDDLTRDSLYGLPPSSKFVISEFLSHPYEEGLYKDNNVYFIENIVDTLVINALAMNSNNYGTTICFTTGDNPVLEIVGDVLWANGATPEIESDTTYELSLRGSMKFGVLAVLVPFKSVE